MVLCAFCNCIVVVAEGMITLRSWMLLFIYAALYSYSL
jgi:hypothetical protein